MIIEHMMTKLEYVRDPDISTPQRQPAGGQALGGGRSQAALMSEGGAPLRQEVLPARRAERSAEAHPHAGSMKLSECPASDHAPWLQKTCKVVGCGQDLAACKAFYKRFLLCPKHSGKNLLVGGVLSRFCQQCSRFHPLSEFEGDRRTCKDKLDLKRKQGYRRAAKKKWLSAQMQVEGPKAPARRPRMHVKAAATAASKAAIKAQASVAIAMEAEISRSSGGRGGGGGGGGGDMAAVAAAAAGMMTSPPCSQAVGAPQVTPLAQMRHHAARSDGSMQQSVPPLSNNRHPGRPAADDCQPTTAGAGSGTGLFTPRPGTLSLSLAQQVKFKPEPLDTSQRQMVKEKEATCSSSSRLLMGSDASARAASMDQLRQYAISHSAAAVPLRASVIDDILLQMAASAPPCGPHKSCLLHHQRRVDSSDFHAQYRPRDPKLCIKQATSSYVASSSANSSNVSCYSPAGSHPAQSSQQQQQAISCSQQLHLDMYQKPQHTGMMPYQLLQLQRWQQAAAASGAPGPGPGLGLVHAWTYGARSDDVLSSASAHIGVPDPDDQMLLMGALMDLAW